MQKTLTGVRSLLDGGVPVVRNKTAGRGAGVLIIDVDEGLAAFALNSAGANIKFLLAELAVSEGGVRGELFSIDDVY